MIMQSVIYIIGPSVPYMSSTLLHNDTYTSAVLALDLVVYLFLGHPPSSTVVRTARSSPSPYAASCSEIPSSECKSRHFLFLCGSHRYPYLQISISRSNIYKIFDHRHQSQYSTVEFSADTLLIYPTYSWAARLSWFKSLSFFRYGMVHWGFSLGVCGGSNQMYM